MLTSMILLCITNISFAQTNPRTYTGGRFTLDLAGTQGVLTPVEKGDTLIYTIIKPSDSILVKKKFKTIPLPQGKKYYLKFNVKKKLS